MHRLVDVMDLVIGKALALAALVAATAEYAIMMRRRADLRSEAQAAVNAALRGMVRMLSDDDARRAARLRR